MTHDVASHLTSEEAPRQLLRVQSLIFGGTIDCASRRPVVRGMCALVPCLGRAVVRRIGPTRGLTLRVRPPAPARARSSRRCSQLGLAKIGGDESLAWFREAEIKHGRVCMAAFTGLVVTQGIGLTFPLPLNMAGDKFASLGKEPFAAWDNLSLEGKESIIGFIGILEVLGEAEKPHYMMGGKAGSAKLQWAFGKQARCAATPPPPPLVSHLCEGAEEGARARRVASAYARERLGRPSIAYARARVARVRARVLLHVRDHLSTLFSPRDQTVSPSSPSSSPTRVLFRGAPQILGDMPEEKKRTKRISEIQNGRLAMIGTMGYVSAACIEGSVPPFTKIVSHYAGNPFVPF